VLRLNSASPPKEELTAAAAITHMSNAVAGATTKSKSGSGVVSLSRFALSSPHVLRRRVPSCFFYL